MSKFHEALLGVFEAINDEIDVISAEQTDLREYVEGMEEEIMSLDDDDYDDDEDDDDVFDEEEEYERVVCPECGKDIIYQPAVYDEDEDLCCPNCGKPFKR